jgi:Flp pilus assembly pilin Flp
MKKFLLKLWQDEEGAETAEWLVIVALLVAVGVTVYGATGAGSLGEMLTGIIGAIDAVVDPLPAG